MKKQKVSEFIKGKSFYLVLLTGLCAVVVIALVYTNLLPGRSNNGLIDLNEPMPEVVLDNNSSTDIAYKGSEVKNPDAVGTANANSMVAETVEDGSQLKSNIASNEETLQPDTKETMGTTVIDNETQVTDEIADTVTGPIVQTSTKKSVSLSFKEKDGLMWPVTGNILLNYSMDHGVYFQTLGQYKVNPAILIDGEVGTKVVSAAHGIVSEITNNEETGLTITTAIGDGYSLVYGQIASAKVEVGDTISEGTIIGYIAEPTKYYVVEGSNLYFQVLKGDETVDPMQLLR